MSKKLYNKIKCFLSFHQFSEHLFKSVDDKWHILVNSCNACNFKTERVIKRPPPRTIMVTIPKELEKFFDAKTED